jgi:hypothetical protein
MCYRCFDCPRNFHRMDCLIGGRRVAFRVRFYASSIPLKFPRKIGSIQLLSDSSESGCYYCDFLESFTQQILTIIYKLQRTITTRRSSRQCSSSLATEYIEGISMAKKSFELTESDLKKSKGLHI